MALRLLADALKERGIAHAVTLPPPDQDPWSWKSPGRIVPGNHPMGTTRMAARAADGVVDPQGGVQDTSNLYVLGPSVFPRGGYANPMMTTLALAARLADHLAAGGMP